MPITLTGRNETGAPLSAAQQSTDAAALETFLNGLEAASTAKAPLNSPSLTGTPTTTTPPANDSSPRIPNTAWVQAEIADVVGGGAPSSASNITWNPPHLNSTPITVAAKFAKRYSVEDFGAVGDFIANDTLAIQRAIDAAGAETVGSGNIATGWTVDFPPGIFRHTGLILKNRVLLKGSGKRQTMLFLNSGSNKHSITNIDAGNATYATGFQAAGCQDLMIHGGYTRTTNAHYGTSATSQGADDGSWATSYDGIHLECHGTISANTAVAPELTGDPRCILNNVIVTGCAGTGVFLGGPGAYTGGTSYLLFGSGAMVVSELQIYDCRRYGLHNIMNDQHFMGIEVGPCDWGGVVADGAQCCWTNCKAWYSGRDSSKWSLARALYATGQANSRLLQPRHFGACWNIKDNNTLLGIKAQDSAGHAIVAESLKISIIGANLDQIGELIGPPGAAEWETLNGTTTDRWGVYLHGTADTFCRVDAVLTSKNGLSKAKGIVRTRGPGNSIAVSGNAAHFSGTVAVERDAGVTTPYSYNGKRIGDPIAIPVMLPEPTSTTYPIRRKDGVKYKITGLVHKLTGGTTPTATAALQINGTNITGLSAVAVTSTEATATATAANAVAGTERVELVLTGVAGTPTWLEATILGETT